MKHTFITSVFLAASVLLTGCGGSGSDNNDPNAVLDGINFSLGGELGSSLNGTIPSSKDNEFPYIVSYPDLIETNQTSTERIDVVFNIEANLDEVYLTVRGANKYLSFEQVTADETPVSTEAISISVELTDEVNDGNFCLLLSSSDKVGLLSDVSEVCFTVSTNADTGGRVIYFADFSNNSTLSTLNFDTGEVINIGQVGYVLTDIALFDNRMFGVTFEELVEIDIQTGRGQLIGSIGFDGVNALEGGPNGLIAASLDNEVILINDETGSGDIFNFLSDGAYTSGDLVFNDDNTVLFGSVIVPGLTNDQLVTIDPETGDNNIVGDIGFDKVYGLAYLRGQLLGLTDDGEFIIINPTTGLGTLVDNTDAFSAGGAASKSVNE